MFDRLTKQPLFVLLMGLSAALMLLPAAHAVSLRNFDVSRPFFYSALLFGFITAMIAISMDGRGFGRHQARNQLLTLLATFFVLPVMLAFPFYEAQGRMSFLDAWVEMVSCLTTTGATLFDNPWRLNVTLHLWRSIVGWMGGYFMWVAAFAILAPMNLGGFEVRSSGVAGSGRNLNQISRIADPSERFFRFAIRLGPIYLGITLALWIGLMMAGDRSFVALAHAMATVSTSGISPIGGLYWSHGNIFGEVLIFIAFVFAVSRLTFSRGLIGEERVPLARDPEVQMAIALILVVPAGLFLRHFIGSIETGEGELGVLNGIQALWGGIFTALSFLTTTGFESRYWSVASSWSHLNTPGLALIGLALIGGGIATTAGGVKLLRVYALFRHSERELEKLVHPSSLGGAGIEARQIRRSGAFVAWIFFMIFALSIIGVLVALALTGVQFENALVIAVAALSTTGPILDIAAEAPIALSGLQDISKFIIASAMVLGRLEALAIIALLNPDFWRN